MVVGIELMMSGLLCSQKKHLVMKSSAAWRNNSKMLVRILISKSIEERPSNSSEKLKLVNSKAGLDLFLLLCTNVALLACLKDKM